MTVAVDVRQYCAANGLLATAATAQLTVNALLPRCHRLCRAITGAALSPPLPPPRYHQ
jgi:hypothetical protein